MGSSCAEVAPLVADPDLGSETKAKALWERLREASATALDERDLSWATSVLGISAQVNMGTVSQAFRRLARLVHPDKNNNSPDANVVFKTLNDAFTFFKDQCAQAQAKACEERERREHAKRHREESLRERRNEAERRLLDIINQNSLYINIAALETALDNAFRLGVLWETIESGRSRLARARAVQQNAACEAAGGANLQAGGERAQAVRVEHSTNTDEFYAVGLFDCHCGKEHVWALESRGPTGSTPFGAGSSIAPIPGPAGALASGMLEAVHIMEERYLEFTGLEITQATEHWSKRRGQWCSLGKQAIQMPGYDVPQVIWQFQRHDCADGYGPGWHNFRSDPMTGVDSSAMVELLYQTELRWQDLGSSEGAMSVNDSRDVRSGQYSYRLTFQQPLNPGAATQGQQANTSTGVQRNVRRLGVGSKCACVMCGQPGAIPQAPAWSQPLPQGAASNAEAWKSFEEPPPPVLPPPDAEHALLQMLRSPGQEGGRPACWTRARDEDELPQARGREAELVKTVFLATLGQPRDQVTFGNISRIQNEKVWSEFKVGGQEKLMFHGCRSSANEVSILANGFQVSQCRSGGANYGTWFAHISSYSDGGYAFQDAASWRHLFVCLVTNLDVKLDDATMRVVGQSCAYPAWLVRYKHH